ncbi:MAG: hypothetical protein GX434_03300 [Peptococcaceae bacterium]|nr:hypothetical protein [Peptococcaceae bacterium]
MEVLYPDCRDALSANLQDNSPQLVKLLKGLKTESTGVAGWLVGFANTDKVVFYNHAHMLTYSITHRRFLSAIDLTSIDAGHIQGSIVTNFSFSPSGDYVVINNGLAENQSSWQGKMYLANLRDGSILEIGAANHYQIKDSWSSGSSYYAFAANDGTDVTVYSVLSGSKESIIFGQGKVSGLSVTDKGDLVLETNNIFLSLKESGYHWQNLDLKGDILAVSELGIVYYEGNSVRQYRIGSGEDTVLSNLPERFELRGTSRGQAVFTPKKDSASSASMVYNVTENRLYSYAYTYDSPPWLLDWSFSPDCKHCVVLDGDSYRVMDNQGKEEKIQTTKNRVNYRCAWANNTTFIDVLLTGDEVGLMAAGDFAIVVYDLQDKQRKILYEQ